MKICYVIAEYNPLHNGHLKHLNYVKNELKADKVVVIMSGNFTQRGEIAVLNKFERARHAIKCGADLVIELPTIFATANAESFAFGAIKLINGLNLKGELCFGVESGDKENYLTLANVLANESKEYKKALKQELETGVSLAKAKSNAIKSVYNLDYAENLTSLPNNILGLEYVKAIIKTKSLLEFTPMKREGDHNDKKLYKKVTSATSIREVLKIKKIRKLKSVMPKIVYKDLKAYPNKYQEFAILSLIQQGVDALKTCPDCTEGLENRINAFSTKCTSLEDLVKETATKRYKETRIRRIVLSNFLKISSELLAQGIKGETYAKVLAVKKEELDLLSKISQSAKIPVLTRKTDEAKLEKVAKKVFEKDLLANDLYNFITNEKTNPHQMLII